MPSNLLYTHLIESSQHLYEVSDVPSTSRQAGPNSYSPEVVVSELKTRLFPLHTASWTTEGTLSRGHFGLDTVLKIAR